MDKALSTRNRATKIRFTRKIHRWLMLFVGLQFVVWSASGIYMVIPSIHYIHGDNWVNTHSASLSSKDINYSLHDLLNRYPGATNISLGKLGHQSIYRLVNENKTLMLDANTGNLIKPLTQSDVRSLMPFLIDSTSQSNSQTAIVDIALISENAPSELGSTPLPVWRVDLDTWDKVSLYISPQSGELVKVRHHSWRLFDWMWRFHIMDYINGEDISNMLLACVSVIALASALAGLFLLYLCFAPKPKNTKMQNKNVGDIA